MIYFSNLALILLKQRAEQKVRSGKLTTYYCLKAFRLKTTAMPSESARSAR